MIFYDFLKAIFQIVIYEESKSIWLYQKSTHACLVLCGTRDPQFKHLFEFISANEREEKRRE
jgi:hypothetical protein